ncbi:MAG: peroxiredoxin family protein [Gemmatimonadales bacterium]
MLLGVPPLHAQIRGVMLEDTRPGRSAPTLELPQVTAAGVSPVPYELAQELGLVVVLSFCPSLADAGCLGVWRGWQEVRQVFGGGVSVVGISTDSTAAAASLVGLAGLRGRFLSDDGGREARRWGVRTPRPGQAAVFVISPEGRLEYRDLQYDPLDSAAWGRLWQAVARVRMPARS